MIRHLLHAQSINLGYLRSLVGDLAEDQICQQPARGMNHAAWVLGHIVTAADLVCQLLGEKTGLSAEWQERFGMGSHPVADRSRYPGKDELWRQVEDAYGRVRAAIERMPERRMAEPMPMAELADIWPTLGDGIVYLLAAHDATHIGQLSAWRRALGLKAAFG